MRMCEQAAALAGLLAVPAVLLAGGEAPVVISQAYGGGGLAGAVFTHDYVELFNRSQASQDLGGWSIQYAASTGSTWTVTQIPQGTQLAPGQYFLIRMAGGANGSALPTPDLTGTTNMGTSNGKVALVRTAVALVGACPASTDIVDLLGYGSSNCAEGLTAPAIGALIAVIRTDSCVDTNANRSDFSVTITPSPRNTAVTDPTCPPPPPPDCRADFNADGDLNADDLADFINCFFAETTTPGACPGLTGADYNADGDANPDDLGDYINEFFAGCG